MHFQALLIDLGYTFNDQSMIFILLARECIPIGYITISLFWAINLNKNNWLLKLGTKYY